MNVSDVGWDWIILMGFVCACCSLASFYFGWRTRPMREAPPRAHRQVTVDVDGFCRLIRGWEWLDIDEAGATVGVTLRGVGGTTGMRLALLQVENEIERGDLLPIRADRVASLLRPSRPYHGTEGVTIGQPGIPPLPRHDPTQPEPGAFGECPHCGVAPDVLYAHMLTCPRAGSGR